MIRAEEVTPQTSHIGSSVEFKRWVFETEGRLGTSYIFLVGAVRAAVVAVNFVRTFGACGFAWRLRVRVAVSPASRKSGDHSRTGGDTGGLPVLHGGDQNPNHCDEGQLKNCAGQVRP
jgi:hypothetical protein